MAAEQNVDLDAINRSKFKDLPPIQTQFYDKPLPAIREPLSRQSSRSIPSSRRDLDRGYRRLNPRSALYHLFSRPKVEKQRGYNEPGFVASPATDTYRAAPSPELVIQQPSPATAHFEPPYRRPSTSLSSRDEHRRLNRSRTPTLIEGPTQEESPKHPSLFDVYSDSSKVTIAQAIDESSTMRLPRSRKTNPSHIVPAIINEEKRGSVDSGKLEKVHSRSGRNSLSHSLFQSKIFALCTDGLVLQYAEKGGGERLPERALQLGPDSAAFACDLVPGRPYVLQIDQKASSAEIQNVPTQSLLTKMGLKVNLPRMGDHSMLLILDTAEELTSWMNFVRRQIQSMGDNPNHADKALPCEPASSLFPKIRVRQRGSMSQDSMPAGSVHNISTESSATSTCSEARRGSNATASLSTRSQHEPADVRPRRVSNAAITRKPVPQRDGRDKVKEMTSPEISMAHDSPVSVSAHDSVISMNAEQARKRIVRDYDASQVSSIGSLNDEVGIDSPILPRSLNISDRPTINPIVGKPRPDSFVADLPMLWPVRKVDHPVSTTKQQMQPTLEHAMQSPVKLQVRPSVQLAKNQVRSPIMNQTLSTPKTSTTPPTVARLPLKINPSTAGLDVPRQRPWDMPVRPTASAPRPTESYTYTRKPERTPSLSLFPAAGASPSPSAPLPTKPLPPSSLAPGDNTTNSQNRALRRPASIQVRANHAPFLSSVRNMNSARPQLYKAESSPCLRTINTLPRVAETKKSSSSPLPPLDLGMPIVGLAPPAPPPSLPLPKLPPGALQKPLAV